MKEIYYFSIGVVLMLFILKINCYCGQKEGSARQIQGKWKIEKIKLFYIDRIDKDSLTSEERKGEEFFKNDIGKIVRITLNKFYIYKNGLIDDTLNYIVRADTLIFTDKKTEYFTNNMAVSIFKIKGHTLIIDMISISNKNEVFRWTLKKLTK